MAPTPVDINTYVGNGHKYAQMHFQYPYIAMSFDSFAPLKELQLKMCTQMGVVH